MISGRVLKLAMPSTAKATSLWNDQLVPPARRSATSYSTPVCRNPTQANSPFMKRARSGISFRTSTTRRSSSRKSPAPGGMRMSATK
jgi:hypothetical protein